MVDLSIVMLNYQRVPIVDVSYLVGPMLLSDIIELTSWKACSFFSGPLCS